MLYSQQTIKMLAKLIAKICSFLKKNNRIDDTDLQCFIHMVNQRSNCKPLIGFKYNQIGNPVHTKVETLDYFNYITFVLQIISSLIFDNFMFLHLKAIS